MDRIKKRNMIIVAVLAVVAVSAFIVALMISAGIRSGGDPDHVSPTPETNDIISNVKFFPGKIILASEKNNYKAGEKFTVSVSIDTDESLVVGVDIIIDYDSEALEVVGFSSFDHFTTFPVQRARDNQIYISALTQIGEHLSGEIPVSKITFKAKKAGRTTLIIKFTQGKTTDSNIAEYKTAHDILGSVENLILTID